MASRPPARLRFPAERVPGWVMRRLPALLAAALVLAAGCGPDAPRVELHDLVAELALCSTAAAEGGTGPHVAAGTTPALELPAGAALDFVADVDGAAALAHGGLRALDGARLEVSARLEGESERGLATLSGPLAPGELPLPGRGRRLVELRLRVPGTRGSVLLQRPRIVGSPVGPVASAGAPVARPSPADAAKAPRVRPNVLLFVVDTLRRDRLGAYGDRRGLTPRIDAFAATATVFDEAVAQASWTRPAVASIMTGLFPPAHGVTGLDTALPPEATTLAELLGAAGYTTGAVSTNWHVTPETGLRQGFRRFTLLPEATGDVVVQAGLGMLDAMRATGSGPERPFLLYLHLLDPHAPYAPPADLRRRYAPDVRDKAGTRQDLGRVYASRGRRRERRMIELRALYDGEVAAVDRAFGALEDGLAARGLTADTLVVFVADHGEEFDEHGMLGHGNHLHAEVLDIPLVVRLPGQPRGEHRGDLAQQVDLFATLLRAVGLAPPPGLPGRDLRFPAHGDRAAFSHLRYNGQESESVQLAGWKLILPKTPAAPPLLYDRRRDPGEQRDVAAERPVRSAYLLQRVRGFELGSTLQLRAARAELPDEAVRQLRALGYF